MPAHILINVWSDFVCPFCYLEEPVLAQVEQAFGSRVTVDWRAFELRPDPTPTLPPDGDYLRTVWANSVYPMAAERGLTLRLPPVQPRSRLAHEAERFARVHGQGALMRQALFRAFFEQGRDIGQVEELVAIGQAAGVNAAGLRAALDRGDQRAVVDEDQRQARELGITGVPALVLHRQGDPRAVLLTGAQPEARVSEVVRNLLDERGDRLA